MINMGLATASVVSLITFAVHTFIGGRFAARPLLAASGIPEPCRWLNYFTWHMATAMLLVMTAGYAWSAVRPDAADVAVLLTGMAAIFSSLSVWVAIRGGIPPLRLPASWLFLLIVGAAIWGLSAGR